MSPFMNLIPGPNTTILREMIHQARITKTSSFPILYF